MLVYYHDDEPGDCRLPHNPGRLISPFELVPLGIYFDFFEPDAPNSEAAVADLAARRKYVNRDEITVSRDALKWDYDHKCKTFYEEHMHEDEEIRYIKEGSGYFDVRDEEEQWIRIRVEPGDLLILPAGIYHRFTVDQDENLTAVRLYQAQHKWASLKRGLDTELSEVRKKYCVTRDEFWTSEGFASPPKGWT